MVMCTRYPRNITGCVSVKVPHNRDSCTGHEVYVFFCYVVILIAIVCGQYSML